MPRQRLRTRPQNDREVKWTQNIFAGGMCQDLPASEISDQQVALLENVLAQNSYLEARPGAVRYSDKLNQPPSGSSGTWHAAAFNPAGQAWGKWLAHRGAKLFVANDPITAWGSLPRADYDGNHGTAFSVDADSTIVPYRRGFLIFTASGIFCAQNNGGWYQINVPNPPTGLPQSLTGSAYRYRYLITFTRIVDNTGVAVADRNATGAVIEHESGSNDPAENPTNTARLTDYGEVQVGSPISAAAGYTFSNAVLKASGFNDTGVSYGVDPHWTHLSIYRTVDVGANGLNLEAVGVAPADATYTWVADLKRGDIHPLGGGTGISWTDTTTDATLANRQLTGYFNLKTRTLKPLPSGACGLATPGFLFVGDRTDGQPANTLYYCNLGNPERIGYYQPGFQFITLNDAIRALYSSQDVVTVFCANSTYNISLNATQDQSAGTTTITVLTYQVLADRNVGVKDWGSIAPVTVAGVTNLLTQATSIQATLIALCSDHSIRTWNFSKWSEDLASPLVSNEIRQIVPASVSVAGRGSVGAYFAGAYLLWYSKSQSDTSPTKCLRLALSRSAGMGWAYCSGASWPFPPFKMGAVVIHDSNDVQRLIVLQGANSNNCWFWVETFNGPAGSGLTRLDYDQDDNQQPVEILGKVRFRELHGDEEAFFSVFQEGHFYFRPLSEASGYRGAFQVTALGYVDGNVTAQETVQQVAYLGDVQFWKRFEGHRLQVELQMAAGAFRIVRAECHYRVQDKANILQSPITAYDGVQQAALAQQMDHQAFGRLPNLFLDSQTGAVGVITGGNTPIAATGPDSVSGSGIQFVASAAITYGVSGPYGDFSLLFWVANPDPALQLVVVNGSPSLWVTINGTTLSTRAGSVTIPSLASGWHHVALIRTGTSLAVYTDGVLRGTLTDAATYPAAALVVNGSGVPVSGVQFADVRLYAVALAAAALTYYYADITGNGGGKVLPSA